MTKEVLTEGKPKTPPPPPKSRALAPTVIAIVVSVLALMGALALRAASRTNQVSLSSQPRAVTVVEGKGTTFREERRYVGVVHPWVEANVGPQLVSGFVATVLVRPGDRVRQGDVLATLDCRSASSGSESVASQARSLEERQRAFAGEAARLENLVGGGYVSANEVELKRSQAAANQASLDALKAQLRNKSLEVSDCTLRAPFDGEVSARLADPGSFVRPGGTVVTVVDRHLYRVAIDIPEVDVTLVPVGTSAEVTLLASAQHLSARVSRRAPAASASTRTLRLELDVSGKDADVPVGTSAEVRFEVGAPLDAVELPLVAAKVRGGKASLFVVAQGVAKKLQVPVLGERGGSLFVQGVAAGTQVVTEGRAALAEGDPVAATLAAPRASAVTSAATPELPREGHP
ncbi:MAG: efflux RND transporter periplasmic adaptor subunit [Myxococcaceae bacterium]|nr:efflux RND transporter periplasmic adaptor subunit [Myxococcaceae bacterium]